MASEVDRIEQDYPSVELAYEHVAQAYEYAIRRLDAVDGRIQTMQTFAVTLTLAVPAFARAAFGTVDASSVWFVLAIAAFIALVSIGVVARSMGHISLVDPSVLFEKYLDCRPWEFKKDMIFFAGEHARANHKLIRKKGRAVSWMTALFLLETVLLVVWLVAAPSPSVSRGEVWWSL